jgi:uncharacterized membrane protein
MSEDTDVSDSTTPEDAPRTTAAAVSDGARTLFVADFAETGTAWEAYEALASIEDGRHVAIDGVVVVKREADGELTVQTSTDHSTAQGLLWGVVGGAALGLIFPPSLLGSAAVVGAVGAALGKARQLHHRIELTERLEYAIPPGHSGIVAVVSDPGALETRRALARAEAVIETALDQVVAKDLKALAEDSQGSAAPE